MPPTRVAVIGAGAFGRNHLRVYRELQSAHPNLVELVALVEPDPARRDAVSTQYNIPTFATVEDLLASTPKSCHPEQREGPASSNCHPDPEQREGEGPAFALKGTGFSPSVQSPEAKGALAPEGIDAASICVPTIHHASVAEKLLAAHIDILIEKPIAASLEEADRIISLADKHSRIVAVGHLERFNPAVTAATARLNNPMFFEAHRLSIFTPRSLDVDVVLDVMIHDLDVVLSMTNSPIRDVRASGIAILTRKADIANVRVEFESGCVANFTASRVSTEQVRKLRLFQPHQYLSLDFARQELLTISVDPRIAALVSSGISADALAQLAAQQKAATSESESAAHPSAGFTLEKLDLPRAEPLRLELENFLDAVSTRTTPRVDARAGRAALSLALQITTEIAAHAQRAGLQ